MIKLTSIFRGTLPSLSELSCKVSHDCEKSQSSKKTDITTYKLLINEVLSLI